MNGLAKKSSNMLKTGSVATPHFQNLGVILFEELETKLAISASMAKTGIKNALTIDKEKRIIKTQEYSKVKDISKPIKKLAFSAFIGFFKHKTTNYLLFAENVLTTSNFLERFDIYEVFSVVAISLSTWGPDKEITEYCSKLMTNSFYFSYQIDLTTPLSTSNNLTFRTKRKPNWLYMANFQLLGSLMHDKTAEWVIPLVFGSITKIPVNLTEIKATGFLWILMRHSVLNLMNTLPDDPFVQNLTGSHSAKRIDLLLSVSGNVASISIDFLNSPVDQEVTQYRVKRFIEVLNTTFEAEEINVICEDEEKYKNLEKHVKALKRGTDLDYNFFRATPKFNQIVDYDDVFLIFYRCFERRIDADASSSSSIAIVCCDTEAFIDKYLSFVTTLFMCYSKTMIVQAKANNFSKGAASGKKTDERTVSLNYKKNMAEREMNLHLTKVISDQTGTTIRKPSTIQKATTVKISAENTNRLSRISRIDTKSPVFVKEPDQSLSFDTEEEDIEDNAGEFLVDFKSSQFNQIENHITTKITQVRERYSSIDEIHEYFSPTLNEGVVETFVKLFTMKVDKKDVAQEKFMRKCKMLIHSLFCSYESPVISLLKQQNRNGQRPFEVKNLTMCLYTHNVSGFMPTEDSQSQFHYLFSPQCRSHDMLIVSLQEVILMKTKNLKDIIWEGSNVEARVAWKALLAKHLPEFDVYFAKQLCGLLTILLFKKEIKSKFSVKILESDSIKMGKFNLANKGSIMLRLRINHENIVFFNSHLTSGTDEGSYIKRAKNLTSLLDAYRESPPAQLAFFSGDLNFRVQASLSEAVSFLAKIEEINRQLHSIKGALAEANEKFEQLLPDEKIKLMSEHTIASGGLNLSDSAPSQLLRYGSLAERPEGTTKEFYAQEIKAEVNVLRQTNVSGIKDFLEQQKVRLMDDFFKKEELSKLLKETKEISDEVEEYPINFLPTYRFFTGRADYDLHDGKRIPSWTDRILVTRNSSQIFTLNEYMVDKKTSFSDHKPVFMSALLAIKEEHVPVFGQLFDKK